MKVYHDLLQSVLDTGISKTTRNGQTLSLFAQQMRFNMSDGFPAITTKKLAFRSMAAELFWFISGYSDNNELIRLGCNIWTANANADYWQPKARFDGDLGRVYGVQWRSWQAADGTHIDQLADIINTIKTDPNNRRMIVSAWNPAELNQMALPPCHTMFQFYVTDNKLSVHLYQRSADLFLGVPFNIASYALLLHIVAKLTNTVADELVITLGDTHIYTNHIDAVTTQLARDYYDLPTLWLRPDISSLDDFDTKKLSQPNDIYTLAKLIDYQYHPSIKAPMAV